MDFNQFLTVSIPSAVVGAGIALWFVRRFPVASIRWLNKVAAKSKALAEKVEAEIKEHT